MMRRKKADLGGTYFMTCGISVRCAAKQPRNTAANFVSFGIIVIHCPKQARAAFANLVAMAVIVLDRTKKTGAAGDFLLCHSEIPPIMLVFLFTESRMALDGKMRTRRSVE